MKIGDVVEVKSIPGVCYLTHIGLYAKITSINRYEIKAVILKNYGTPKLCQHHQGQEFRYDRNNLKPARFKLI